MSFNVTLAPPPLPTGPPPAVPPPPVGNYGYPPQSGAAARGSYTAPPAYGAGGDGQYAAYNTGYAGYNYTASTAPYQSQWSDPNAAYQQQGQATAQTASYSVPATATYQQGVNGAYSYGNQTYPYENQNYAYSAPQAYQGQAYSGAGAQGTQGTNAGGGWDQKTQGTNAGGGWDQKTQGTNAGGGWDQKTQGTNAGGGWDQKTQGTNAGGGWDQKTQGTTTGGSWDQQTQQGIGGGWDQSQNNAWSGGHVDSGNRASSGQNGGVAAFGYAEGFKRGGGAAAVGRGVGAARGRGDANRGRGGAPWMGGSSSASGVGGGVAPGRGRSFGGQQDFGSEVGYSSRDAGTAGGRGTGGRGRGDSASRGRGVGGTSWQSSNQSSAGDANRSSMTPGSGRGSSTTYQGRGGMTDRGRGSFDRGRGMTDRGRGGFGRGRGGTPNESGDHLGGGSFSFGGGADRTGSDRGRGSGGRGRDGGFDRGGRDTSNYRGGGSDRGRGGAFERGRGMSHRGGGASDRGGSGMRGRGMGSMDRGRGQPFRGGRGGGDRGGRGRGGMGDRGGRGDAGDRGGRGSYGGGPRENQAFFTSSSGVGLSSLGDVIKSAKSRQFSNTFVQSCVGTDSLTKLVAHLKNFLSTFNDCGNTITTMECSLIASKVRYLQLRYTTAPLCQCNHYCIFTGSLYLKKVSDTQLKEESIFLTRGLGLTKKNAKLDAYQKGYNLLKNSTVAEIMSQKDTNDSALIEEVTCLFKEDPFGFMALLKKSNTECDLAIGGTEAMVDASRKRTATDDGGGLDFASKRSKLSDKVATMLETNSTSLVPKKQVGAVIDPNSSLFDKLTKLKQLLKEEGITKLHIVPKIDQLGIKSALNIRNVYRFIDIPRHGEEDMTPVFCEIFFDNVYMTRGDVNLKHTAAMHSAYTILVNRLCKEPLESIVHCSGTFWQEYMARDLDVCDVVVKRAGEDNDTLLTTNLANMKQMMQRGPDFSIPIEKFVLLEFEADTKMENSYKMLELSATRNCMLLECELVRNQEKRFTCIMSMQGKQVSMRTSHTKNGAKRTCSDSIIAKLSRTNDIVFVGKDIVGPIYTRTLLLEAAKKAKEEGVEPLKCYLQKDDVKIPLFKTPEEAARWEEDKRKAREVENLAENKRDLPFIPWMGRVLADYILDYHKNVSLLDLRVHLHDMPKSMRDMVQIVSSRLGLRTVSKLRDGEHAILRRSIPALEVTKILGVNDGVSGRVKMKQCKHPWPAKELEEYKAELVTKYTKMYDELIKDTNSEPETETKTKTT